MSENNFYQLRIADVHPETDTAVCVRFDVPEALAEKFRFIQGQFLTLRTNIEAKDVRRSYSICAGVDDGELRVAIKRVKNGLFSNYANDHFKAGDEVEVMPPQGSFHTTIHADHEKSYMCLAAGSGITPIISIIKSVLQGEPKSRVCLIYGNRSTASMMFRDQLSFIKNQYMDRFQWINIMDEEDQGVDLFNGRIDNQKGAALHTAGLIDVISTDEAFICGPQAMMSEVSRGFRASGLADEQIHYELFSSSSEDSERMLQKSQQRVKDYGEEKTSKITVTADGRSISFELATVGENILDAGLHHGLELPYACKAGVCATCKCKLVKGEVEMDISHGLEPHEIKAGYILSCQAHPLSDEVEVDFDQRN